MLKGQVRVDLERLDIPGLDKALAGKAMEIAGRIVTRARGTSAFADKSGTLRKRIDAVDHDQLGVIARARAPHAHLVEFGHDVVRGGRVVGQAKPHPFLRPAADEELARAAQEFAQAVENSLPGVTSK